MNWRSMRIKPSVYEWVLVSFAGENRERLPDTCIVGALWETDESDLAWYDGNRFYTIHDTDYWAYIELPIEFPED